jgi:hypothetical protein
LILHTVENIWKLWGLYSVPSTLAFVTYKAISNTDHKNFTIKMTGYIKTASLH